MSIINGRPLPQDIGNRIMTDGKKLGESEHVKGSWWSAHEYEGRHFISLDEDGVYTWEVPYEDFEKEYGIEFDTPGI